MISSISKRLYHQSSRQLMSIDQISVQQLKQLFDGKDLTNLKVKDVQMVDVREKDELEKANYPNPGIQDKSVMLHLPLSEMEKWGPSVLDGTLIDISKPVVVNCRSGVRAKKFSEWLNSQSDAEIYVIQGGILAYASEVDSTVGES
mmetsp:Transcript_14577/g.18907  ORF Transcript_14577/g.18907 Transcript_14577/m.18907 type:complete len:146 (+) Transcript_14577:60-497(+)